MMYVRMNACLFYGMYIINIRLKSLQIGSEIFPKALERGTRDFAIRASEFELES